MYMILAIDFVESEIYPKIYDRLLIILSFVAIAGKPHLK